MKDLLNKELYPNMENMIDIIRQMYIGLNVIGEEKGVYLSLGYSDGMAKYINKSKCNEMSKNVTIISRGESMASFSYEYISIDSSWTRSIVCNIKVEDNVVTLSIKHGEDTFTYEIVLDRERETDNLFFIYEKNKPLFYIEMRGHIIYDYTLNILYMMSNGNTSITRFEDINKFHTIVRGNSRITTPLKLLNHINIPKVHGTHKMFSMYNKYDRFSHKNGITMKTERATGVYIISVYPTEYTVFTYVFSRNTGDLLSVIFPMDTGIDYLARVKDNLKEDK